MILAKKKEKGEKERKKASRPAFNNKRAGDTCSGDLFHEFKKICMIERTKLACRYCPSHE